MRTQLSASAPPPAHPFPLIHDEKERRSPEPTTNREPSPCGDGPSRVRSTEAAPEERPALYIGAPDIAVQSKAICAPRKSTAVPFRAASEQAERAQFLHHLRRQ